MQALAARSCTARGGSVVEVSNRVKKQNGMKLRPGRRCTLCEVASMSEAWVDKKSRVSWRTRSQFRFWRELMYTWLPLTVKFSHTANHPDIDPTTSGSSPLRLQQRATAGSNSHKVCSIADRRTQAVCICSFFADRARVPFFVVCSFFFLPSSRPVLIFFGSRPGGCDRGRAPTIAGPSALLVLGSHGPRIRVRLG